MPDLSIILKIDDCIRMHWDSATDNYVFCSSDTRLYVAVSVL